MIAGLTSGRGGLSGIQDRVLFAALIVVVGILSLLPLARLLVEAIAPQGRPSLTTMAAVFSSPATWKATAHSIEISVGGTVLATVLGMSDMEIAQLSEAGILA